jgi:PAS domain S-box-containing protein
MPPDLRDAADTLDVRIALLDADGTVVAATRGWTQFVDERDHPLAATAAPYLDALLASDDGQAHRLGEHLRAALDDGGDGGSYAYSDDDGNAISVQYAAIEGPDGRYVAVHHADHVPPSETATADLHLKERAMDEAPVGITISDPSLPDNPVVYANAAFERITGYGVDEVVGRNCRFLQGEETDEAAVARMRHAVDNWESVTVDVRNYRKNGEQFWNQVTIAPIYDDGEPTHFVGFQQDVTARKRAERDLETERDRLALLNQVVRHDIRNDMAVVLAWGEELDDRLDGDHREMLERIMRAATHASDLTESVGDLAELIGATDPDLDAVALDEVLVEEIARVRSSFDYRSQPIEIRGDEDVPAVEVWATPLLSSVFGNLLDNAVFHNDKAEVEIDVDVTVDPETVVVRVADNGPGVPDDRKREVFGRGEKGLESPGSGLGLYLVDNLVETYGGSVWIEDREGGGAVFCVELRRA